MLGEKSVRLTRGWKGDHVQEESSKRESELQEPQRFAEQRERRREDGERSGRCRRSVLRTGLSQQTVSEQQRGILWHRLQGEQRHTVKPISQSIDPRSHVAKQVCTAEVRTPETKESCAKHGKKAEFYLVFLSILSLKWSFLICNFLVKVTGFMEALCY